MEATKQDSATWEELAATKPGTILVDRMDDVYKVCLGCQKELRTRHADDEVDDIIDEIYRADKERNPRPNQTQR